MTQFPWFIALQQHDLLSLMSTNSNVNFHISEFDPINLQYNIQRYFWLSLIQIFKMSHFYKMHLILDNWWYFQWEVNTIMVYEMQYTPHLCQIIRLFGVYLFFCNKLNYSKSSCIKTWSIERKPYLNSHDQEDIIFDEFREHKEITVSLIKMETVNILLDLGELWQRPWQCCVFLCVAQHGSTLGKHASVGGQFWNTCIWSHHINILRPGPPFTNMA